MFDLTGQVAVVTGSTRGIGKAIAHAMGKAGAKVVVSSRKADACEATGKELAADGIDVLAMPCNISRTDDLERMVQATRDKWGRIDTLVCNAAINPHYGPAFSITDEQFDKIMGANVRGTLRLCGLVVPEMAERGSGSVVVVGSTAGFMGTPVIGAYAMSKAAEAQLVRNLAVEYGPKGVRVNGIAPGLIQTDFARALWENPDFRSVMEKRAPLRRIGQPEDIAGAAVFLASRASAFMTGQIVVVDGGITISEGG